MVAPRGTEHPWHALPGRGARPQAAELQRFCSPAATAQPRAEPGMPPRVQGLRAMEKRCPATVANYIPLPAIRDFSAWSVQAGVEEDFGGFTRKAHKMHRAAARPLPCSPVPLQQQS